MSLPQLWRKTKIGSNNGRFLSDKVEYPANIVCNMFSDKKEMYVGGGQPYVREFFLPDEDDDILDTYKEKRAKALYSEDERQTLRQSHNNPQIKERYDKVLGEPNSHKAHELLHTTYAERVGFNDIE